ncbi:MAG: T9SS type A sorting domain-containing protein [Bacteroidota bacterium]
MYKKLPFLLFLLFLLPNKPMLAQFQQGNDLLGAEADDNFGFSVDLSGNGQRLIVGTPLADPTFELLGEVKVFEQTDFDWVQIGSTINGSDNADFLGYDVAISEDGNTIAIGGTAPSNIQVPGQARVYQWIDNEWQLQGGVIYGENFEDQFGSAIALSTDGQRIAVGAPYNDGNGMSAGHVRVLEWNGNEWIQMGEDIDGENAGDFSGSALAMSANGSRIAIGAPNNDGNADASGHVRVYEWTNNTWSQLGEDIDGEESSDLSGGAVSMSADGNRIAIGAINNDGLSDFVGHTRVYDWENGAWVQVGADIDGDNFGDWLGASVSLAADGQLLAISAIRSDVGAMEDVGRVRMYFWDSYNEEWSIVFGDLIGKAARDWFGNDIALAPDGSHIAIGARMNDDNGEDAGLVQVYLLSAVSIGEESALAAQFSIQPNPTEGRFSIDGPQKGTIRILNILGQALQQHPALTVQTIDIAEWPSGIYYIQLDTGSHSIVKKLIKE